MEFRIESHHGECWVGRRGEGWLGIRNWDEFRDDGMSRGRRDGGRDVRSAVGIANRSVWERGEETDYRESGRGGGERRGEIGTGEGITGAFGQFEFGKNSRMRRAVVWKFECGEGTRVAGGMVGNGVNLGAVCRASRCEVGEE